jgi:dihydropteroate synthase
MGVVNLSPESFHPGSVHTRDDDLLRAALGMAEAGAALIDVGARSTAPYLDTAISEAAERDRLAWAVELLARKIPVPISADTARPAPARAALEAGARVINDVTGLRDPAVAALVLKHRASVILTATPGGGGGAGGPSETTLDRRRGPRRPPPSHPQDPIAPAKPALEPRHDPVATVMTLLSEALERARAAGIPEDRIVVDPGIGFFREEGMPWHEWDVRVLAGLGALRPLGRPICVGVSRKSFLGAITGHARPEERLAGSLAATAVAVWNGAALIRTHDVVETLDAIRVAEHLRRARAP